MNKQICKREVADLDQINRCIRSLEEANPSVLKLTSILKLAGNEVRLKILYILSREDRLCPCDLSDILDMSIPAVSQHLRKLKDGGVLTTRRERQVIYYEMPQAYQNILAPLFNHLPENKLLEVLAA